MKIRIVTLAILLGLSAAWLLTPSQRHFKSVEASVRAGDARLVADNPCEFPRVVNGMPDAEIAWRLFVAATCPVANDPNAVVKWEQWKEQEEVFPPVSQPGAAPQSRFHQSRLAQIMNGGGGLQELNLGTATCALGARPAYPNGPKRLICEEVRINPEAVAYITSNGFQNRSAQALVAKNHGKFDFPKSGIEMKMDWIQLNTLDSCDHPAQNPAVHYEKATDPKTKAVHCYALAALHINSKLTTNWVWATWEPQDNTINPLRCFVLGCNDSWGATPTKLAANQPTPPSSNQTAVLTVLMKQAGLAPEWFNYRLDGVQTEFVDKQGHPLLLGNSVTEGESVGLDLHKASCITCHDSSSIKNDGTDGATLLKHGTAHIRPIGLPDKWPPPNDGNWVRRDFAWSFVLAPAEKAK